MIALWDRIVDFMLIGLLSLLGGIATYVNQIIKGKREFQWLQFTAHCVLAFLVGNMISPFIPASMEHRDGILMLAGFISPQIMTLLEAKASKFFEFLIGNKSK